MGIVYGDTFSEVTVLKPGENPREVLPVHEERGPVSHVFTLEEVAVSAGVTYATARKAVSDGRLNPLDLLSVVMFVQRGRAKAVKCHLEEVVSALPPEQKKWWPGRWPEFNLYSCAHKGCPAYLFSAGFCVNHGGDRRAPLRFDSNWHIHVLIKGEDYMPLPQLIVQPASGRHTHHRDGNPWNNRISNLEDLDPREHESRHAGGLIDSPVLPNQPPAMRLRPAPGMVYLSRADLQSLKDEAYQRGLQDGKRRR